MAIHLLGFLLCASIIFFAGKRLSHYGDLLADLSGLGKAWIGLILMAAVTSLPELMVGISSATIVQSADLAVGDILGSCAFNLGILSLMDIFTPKDKPLFSNVSRSHILAAAFGIILIALVGLNLFLEKDIELTPFLALTSFSFVIVYLIAMRTIFNYQKNNVVINAGSEEVETNLSLKQVVIRYAFFASIIIVTALALPYFAGHIAEDTGLGKSFVGTLFLAISTSLPEIAVSLAAIRMGSTDMAVGNLLGSNLFNVAILFLDDIFYTKGLLLKDASEVNLLSVFFVAMMTGVAIIGFIFPSKEKKILMSWDTFTIFGLYVVNMVLLFFLTK
ncbi:MAG: sodium:calcium antiporter [Bacteroidia bacterium]|nr:sodium:calcium antiporter [Bacteroidia bacterium]